jgi:hypothetical protein
MIVFLKITIDLSLSCDEYQLIGSSVDDSHRRKLEEQRIRVTARSYHLLVIRGQVPRYLQLSTEINNDQR